MSKRIHPELPDMTHILKSSQNIEILRKQAKEREYYYRRQFIHRVKPLFMTFFLSCTELFSDIKFIIYDKFVSVFLSTYFPEGFIVPIFYLLYQNAIILKDGVVSMTPLVPNRRILGIKFNDLTYDKCYSLLADSDGLPIPYVLSITQSGYNCLLNTTGGPYAVGISNYNGQLGVGKYNGNLLLEIFPTKMIITDDSLSIGAIQISCFHTHTMIITQESSLYGCGKNAHGELGLNDYNDRYELTRITDSVIAVSCGFRFSIILKQDGSLYSAGYNNIGKLGLGNISSPTIPLFTKISKDVRSKLLPSFKSIVCSEHKTIVRCSDGKFYGFGSNESRDLGDDKYVTNYKRPEVVNLLNMGNIKYFGSGTSHSIYLTDKNELYGCGSNETTHPLFSPESTYYSNMDIAPTILLWSGDQYNIKFKQNTLRRIDLNINRNEEEIIYAYCLSDGICIHTTKRFIIYGDYQFPGGQ